MTRETQSVYVMLRMTRAQRAILDAALTEHNTAPNARLVSMNMFLLLRAGLASESDVPAGRPRGGRKRV